MVDLWQRFADGWPDAVLAFDRELRLIGANAEAAALLGAASETLVGKRLVALIPETACALEPLVVQAFAQGEILMRGVHPFEDAGPFHVRMHRLPDDEVVVAALQRQRPDAALEASEERFRSLFDANPEAMLEISLEGIVTRANAATARVFGFDGAALLGRPLRDLVQPEDLARLDTELERAAAGEPLTVELTAVRGDGGPLPLRATLIPIRSRGAIVGVYAVARDLSLRRRAEREVAAQTERLRELYLVAAAANATAENQIAATIDAGCRLLGMVSGTLYDAEADRSVATVGEPIPRQLARLALATDGALAIEDLRGLPHIGEPEPGEVGPGAYIGTAIAVGGAPYGSLSFASAEPREPFTPSDRDLVQMMGVLVGTAIERGRSRARLKHLAYNDQLTALPNRAWFTERLADELALAAGSGTRVAVMFLDLDRFKDINDTLGHALGDRLLRIIGDRLTSAVGAHGLVARMGGDEFIVLIANAPSTQRLGVLAERIIDAIDQPLMIDGFEQFVTTSIGIAVYPMDGNDADTLIKHADVAMYRAKERGRNTSEFFTPALGASLRTRISQEKSLRKALEREEFVVHYQPQFDLASGRLVSLEALVRWQHPR
ncbi:MAG TPA: diguanylate cyclase, partial [Candidatus Acidoferrum sp.]|nr:diguanylate cyclase [Candidatus Acidoferrum sp.]